MANLPTVFLAQTLTLAGTISFSVTDSFSTRTITIVAGGTTRYSRVYLAVRTDTGTTLATPHELLTTVQTALNAAPGSSYWTVALTTAGVVKITYNGGAGTGTITWTANGLGLRNIFGFTGTATSALAVGGSTTATQPPTGCIVSLCSDASDSAWQTQSASDATATTVSGKTVQFTSGYQSMRRQIRLRLHPALWTNASANEYFSPCHPLDNAANSTRWNTPATTGYLDAVVYSVHEFVATAHRPGADAQIGMSVGEFQSMIAGSITDFDVGSLDADTVRGSENAYPLSVPGWSARRDVPLKITRTSRVTR